jgi:hypothetical protein
VQNANCTDTTAIPQVTAISSDDVDCAQYPHWACDDPALQRIDAFIKAYGGRDYVVATDWDGTLYSETIVVKGDIHTDTKRSGQSIWHLWMERNIIDGAGKEVALRRYIEVRAQSSIVFYAGNSGGVWAAR